MGQSEERQQLAQAEVKLEHIRREQKAETARAKIGGILEGFEQHPECKTTEELFAVTSWAFAERPRDEGTPAA